MLAAALVVVGLGPATAVPPTQIDYELAPVVEHDTTTLTVTLHFVGPAAGSLTFDLPNEGEGEKERWRFFSDFTVTGATIAAPDPATRVLSFAPGAPVTLRYRVASAYADDPDGTDGNTFKGAALRT